MPAQSPTLSPTLSAMVAALRGSSSGMPASTLPTRSAPTSAALVKMPPPTRMKRASSEAPKANPISTAVAEFWKMRTMAVAPASPRPTQSMPVTAPGAEGHPERLGHAAALGGGGGRADVAAHGDAHADEAGQTGEGGAEEEADDPVEAVLLEGQGDPPVGLHHLGGGEEDQDRQRDDDHHDGPELPAQEGLGALLDRLGDLLHLRRALVGGQDVAGEQEAGADADDAGDQADVQPGLVHPAEVEGLVATLGCEEIDHSRCALSVPVGPAGRGRRCPRPCGAAALSTTAFDVVTPGRGRAGEVAPDAGPGGTLATGAGAGNFSHCRHPGDDRGGRSGPGSDRSARPAPARTRG